ncbi:helix-turn-helix transcriptional regulator [Luteococcus sp. OSA5]|uniref:helix-turn-helix transcriptional regulator n=1 Tax=Luteococcus sp. OSA5 TaxID=3401630 RepID=UPI003B43922D
MTKPSTTRLAPTVLARVAEFAVEHHCEQVTVADLADQAGYSRHHFSRAFTATKGISPSAYLTALRIESAKQLLLTDDRPVIDVAVEVGFDSLSSFSRRFSATVGTTPAHLRRLARRLEDCELSPFTVADPRQMLVQVRPVLPTGVDSGRLWLGWYRSPAPIGLPTAGTLTDLDEVVPLPLHPGAPWLLGFLVGSDAAPGDLLAPTLPVVALHPSPVLSPGAIDLCFRFAMLDDLPLLSALPALAG